MAFEKDFEQLFNMTALERNVPNAEPAQAHPYFRF